MKTKRNYQVPSIKVVAFKVEDGFQSPLKVGDTDLGTETYIENSWTVRPFTPVQLNQE